MEKTKLCKKCEKVLPFEDFRQVKKAGGYSNGTCSWCRDCERTTALERYKANREYYIQQNKEYKIKNAEVLKEKRRQYLQNTKEHVRERYKLYCQNNREKLNKIARDYLQNNAHAKLRATYSKRLYEKIKKDKHSDDYAGAPFSLVKKWIEFNFTDEMSWTNHGDMWHIDHTIPIKSFDMENETDIYVCFSWMNLMPLVKEMNRKKADKIVPCRIFHQEVQLKKFVEEHLDLKNDVNEYLMVYSEYFSESLSKYLCATQPNCGNTLTASDTHFH